MKTVIFLSSVRDVPGPYFVSNGQSIVTSCTHQFFSYRFHLLHFLHGQTLFHHLLFGIRVVISLPSIFLSKPVHFSYVVISRSPFGFLRDACIIFCLCLFNKPVLVHLHGRTLPRILSFIVLNIFTLPACKACIHLVLPSLSFFKSNPSWRFFRHSEILNFSEDFAFKTSIDRTFESSSSFPIVSYGNEKTLIRITWNSNLIFSKGLTLLMEGVHVFNCFSSSHRIYLDIFGDYVSDEYCSAEQLEVIVKRLGLQIPCRFYGAVERADTISVLSASDLYVFPSFYSSEFQPLSVIDAMACGIPVISSSLSVLRYLLRDYSDVSFLPAKITPFNLAYCIDSFIKSQSKDSSSTYALPDLHYFSKESFLASLSKLVSAL